MNLQPTIFISSIITEFYDLRGALRYFLNKSGFRVLMSEEPDFGADCGKDSLENCKERIELCDYYMLLIGNNPGSIFQLNDEDTTVTFEEFRHYLKLIREGKKLNFIAFVRIQAWDNYEKKDTTKIHPLQIKLIEELVHNSLFENEVIGRWRYTFNKFIDIITVLETNQNGLFLEATRKKGIYKSYIQRELTDITKAFLQKTEQSTELEAVCEYIKLPDLKLKDFFKSELIEKKTAAFIFAFLTFISYGDSMLRKINRVFNYIAQGEFSYFDSEKQTYTLPEYIKLTIQTLEILEKIIDNSTNVAIYNDLKKRDIDNFYITEHEYSLVKMIHSNYSIVTRKLLNLMRLFHLNWSDFEKRPESFYAYRGMYHDDYTDAEIIEYATKYLAQKKN